MPAALPVTILEMLSVLNLPAEIETNTVFKEHRPLVLDCTPLATVVKSIPLNMIKNVQESLLTEIQPNLTLDTAYRPYIECPPSRGDTARCSPRYFLCWYYISQSPTQNPICNFQ